MKFQKGLLDEFKEVKPARPVDPARPEQPARPPRRFLESDHLFETQQHTASSTRNYLKLFAIVVVLVVAAGGVIAYLTLPDVGDAVRAPQGLEMAVRDHFLLKEKRTATDIIFYYCGDFYWARVGVEKRPDIKTNPLYSLDRYTARATQTEEGTWTISAVPVTSPEIDVPCK